MNKTCRAVQIKSEFKLESNSTESRIKETNFLLVMIFVSLKKYKEHCPRIVFVADSHESMLPFIARVLLHEHSVVLWWM